MSAAIAKPCVKVYRDGREVCSSTPAGRAEYRSRLIWMAERQDWNCALCGKPMLGVDATFDHETPRRMGGGSRDDRIYKPDGTRNNAAVHGVCNYRRGSKPAFYICQ